MVATPSRPGGAAAQVSGCGISFRPPWAFMRSCPRASGTLNQRHKRARARPMLGETIRRKLRDGRPAHRQRLSAGPPKIEAGETSAHATPCRKTPYARRKTRTPRPGGQGVHSEPFGAPVSRAPLEVGRAEQTSNRRLGFGSLGGLDDLRWRRWSRSIWEIRSHVVSHMRSVVVSGQCGSASLGTV